MSQRNFLITICITLFVAVGAWTASVAPAHAGDWRSMNTTDFPAHVGTIIFPSGNRIDSSSSTCWGKWCVTFGPEKPAARVFGGDTIFIKPLACKNPVEGVKECFMDLQPRHNLARIQLAPAGMSFLIQFPKDLILK